MTVNVCNYDEFCDNFGAVVAVFIVNSSYQPGSRPTASILFLDLACGLYSPYHYIIHSKF